ncbi:hypothetical protein BDQ17DRAFT_1425758 [Cyathus striatus]|nr:hypothetical protein BDQ17DRAFT_1425758 [Cyathus striatus]
MRSSVLAFVVCAIYASRVVGAPLVNPNNAVEARSPGRGGRLNLHVGLPPINIGSPPPQQRSFDDIEARSPRGGRLNLHVGLPPINIGSPQPQQRSLDDIEARGRGGSNRHHKRAVADTEIEARARGSLIGVGPMPHLHIGIPNFDLHPQPKIARSFDGSEELEARTPRGGFRGLGRRPGSAPPQERSFDDMEIEARFHKLSGFRMPKLHLPNYDISSPPVQSRSFDEELEARTPRGGFRGGFRGMGRHPSAPAPQQPQERSFDDMEIEARSPKLLGGVRLPKLHIPIPTFDLQSPQPQSRSFDEELEARTPRGGFRGGFRGMGRHPAHLRLSQQPQERSFDDMEIEARSPKLLRGIRLPNLHIPIPTFDVPSTLPQLRSFDDELETRTPRGGSRGRKGGRSSAPVEARAPRGRGGRHGGRRGGFKMPMAVPPTDAPAEQ